VRDALARIREVAPDVDSTMQLALVTGMVGAPALVRAVDDDELSAAMLSETRRFWMQALS
jgi:hypothetical protein